jgi:WD40 repeat protein
MWLGSKFTLLSDSLFKSLFKFLFRYDIFISYARSDGKDYALKLRDQLRQLDFSCFLDFDELPPGNALNNTLKRAIKKSAALVIVGTERAVKSRYVELEVGEFGKTGRAIIPIDIEGTLVETPWKVIKERDIVWIDEVNVALTRGVPSPIVADSIDRLFKYTRRNTRVRAQVLATMILFVVVVAASLFLIQQKVKAANLASVEAEHQKTVANAASVRAEERQKAADEATKRAKDAEANSKVALEKADLAEKDAEKSARKAKTEETKALASAAAARKQQLIAEERTNYLRAQQMSVQADVGIDKGDDVERSALLTVESLKRALTPEGYLAWARGMDLLPRAQEMTFADHEDGVSAIAYSLDGSIFAQGTKSGGLTFFHTDKTAEPVKRQLQSEIKIIAFGKDWVAAASQNQFEMWDLNRFEKIRPSQTPNAFHGQSIAFSPDGHYVAIGGPSTQGMLRVFDTNSRTVIQKSLEHVGNLMSVAFSPDGRWLAIACHYKTYEEPENSANTSEVLNQSGTVGRVIFLGVENFEKGVDVATKPVAWITEEELLYQAVFGPKGEHLATEDIKGVVRIWQVFDSDKQIKLKRPQTQKIRGRGYSPDIGKSTLVFSPDESYIATVPDENTARVWEVSSGNEVSRIMQANAVEGIAFSPNGQFATSSGKVDFWKTEFGGDAKLSYGGNKSPKDLAALAVSPGGEYLVTGNDDGLHVFKTSDWSPITWLEKGSPITKISFSSDGRWLVASGESKVTLIETKSWKPRELFSQPPDPSSKLVVAGFSPDGQRFVIAYGDFVKLFDAHSWKEERTLSANGYIRTVFFGPDSQSLAVAVESKTYIGRDAPKEIYLWNTNTGRPLACRDDQKAGQSESEPTQTTTFPHNVVCSQTAAAEQGIQLSEVRKWKTPSESNLILNSLDGRWSVESDTGLELIFNEGKIPRQVAKLVEGRTLWTFTPDSRWLLIRGGVNVELWPLSIKDMIDAACARLRRHELREGEWRFSDKQLQPCSSHQP